MSAYYLKHLDKGGEERKKDKGGEERKKECVPLFLWGFPGYSGGKESACSAGDPGSIPGLGRSPGEGNGYPLQYSCLDNSMDRGA